MSPTSRLHYELLSPTSRRERFSISKSTSKTLFSPKPISDDIITRRLSTYLGDISFVRLLEPWTAVTKPWRGQPTLYMPYTINISHSPYSKRSSSYMSSSYSYTPSYSTLNTRLYNRLHKISYSSRPVYKSSYKSHTSSHRYF